MHGLEWRCHSTLHCQQICNLRAEYTARNDERPAEVKSLKTQLEKKGLQFLMKRREWRSGSDWLTLPYLHIQHSGH